MRKLIVLSILFAMNIATHVTNASPAYPFPITIKQPNGKTLTILLQGDEKNKGAQTTDGYTLVRGKNNAFEYATLDASNNLIPSGVEASNINSRSENEIHFLKFCKKGLQLSQSQKVSRSKVKINRAKTQSRSFPTIGGRKLLCILMGFSDLAFTKTQADFNNLFNKIDYNDGDATGSVKDYYLENSYGQLDLTITVAGPYTASQNMAYYGTNLSNGNDSAPEALVTEAVSLADKDVNYADFDNDNDGYVDGVYVIYAGYGEEAGAPAEAIWAHAFNITEITLDGKIVSSYSCSAELGSNYGSDITAIGVICHEFGHVLGAPDYYDTDQEDSGGEYPGTLLWDLMAGGSWNNGGKTPANHNGYTKTAIYNWASAQNLTSTQTVTVNAASSTKTNAFYTIPTQVTGEHFFLENRQKIGFDGSIPASGLFIYRVSANVEDGFYNNDINAGYPQKMYLVCAGATTNPNSDPISYGQYLTTSGQYSSTYLNRWPFPGSLAKTSFTDETTPSAKSSSGLPTGYPLTNIVQNATTKVVTFNITKSTTAVETNDVEGISCYPSPFTNELIISCPTQLQGIQLYDITGKLLLQATPRTETTQTINTESLASGYYIVKIIDINGKATTIKAVKE